MQILSLHSLPTVAAETNSKVIMVVTATVSGAERRRETGRCEAELSRTVLFSSVI